MSRFFHTCKSVWNHHMSCFFHTCKLDNVMVSYIDTTVFEVQVGKGRKGKYKTKVKFSGDLTSLGRAVTCYMAINIHSGYKKRLISLDMNRPVLARQFGWA